MTLAQRLLVAIGALTILTTVTLAFVVREALRLSEEDRFQKQFDAAKAHLQVELGNEIRDLPELLSPFCDHDPMLDSALLGVRTGDLDPGFRLRLSLWVRDLMKGLRLDELTLVTEMGEVLGAGHAPGLVGSHDAALAAAVKAFHAERDGARARTRSPDAKGGNAAIVAHCTRTNGSATIALVAARRLESVLERIGESQGLALSLAPPADATNLLVGTVELPEVGNTKIVATRSLVPLFDAIARLDRAILVTGSATFAAALAVAWLLSRGLARPIVRLSEQARQVVTGEPLPIEGGGGRELVELAESFNQTIVDLVLLRKRLAATERISARREIARRVAHEIKNPLAPIRAAVETLRRLHARGDPAFEEYFDEATRTVLGEVARITGIVQEFTKFARLPAPKPEPMDLERTVRDVVGLHAATGARIDLSFTPPADAANALVADRDQIVQVLTNLIQNAMDAVAAVPAPRIVVEVGPGTPQRVRIVVRDNGPGVSEQMRARLFEPYATSKAEGTGLGLAIVERIVVEHGGEIAYRDAEGGGAEFTVVLPLSGPPLATEAPESGPFDVPPAERNADEPGE